MTRYIQRHSKQARVTHAIHTVACLGLIFTGTVLFFPSIGRAVGSDVAQTMRIIHRVMAVLFIAVPILSAILAPRGAKRVFDDLLAKWDDDDRTFMRKFVPYMFGPKRVHMPKQHSVKSGQRVADLAIIILAVFMAVTGVLLWAGFYLGPDVIRWALLVHDVAFVLMIVFMIAHIYLGAGVFQPYRGSGRLMFGDGLVSESDALYHWGYWAEEELASGENVVEIPDKK